MSVARVRRLAMIACVVMALAGAIAWWRGRDSAAPKSSTRAGSAVATATATESSTSDSRRVRKLPAAERKDLAAAIASARERRRAAAGKSTASAPAESPTGDRPALPADETIRLEDVGPVVTEALKEAIPILADCYREVYGDAGVPPPVTAAVEMTMTSEPDIGTVVDADEMLDDQGAPLPRELDDCLRSTIESLGLPPLGKSGQLPLKYSFKFEP